MSKKIFIFISCVLLCTAGIVSAACDWWNTGTDWSGAVSTDWSNPDNWSNGVPTYTQSDGCGLWARLSLNTVGPDIDEDVNTCRMSVAVWCAGNDNIDVNIWSGHVECGWGLAIACNGTLGFNTGEYGRGYGKVNMYGGNVVASRGRTNIDGQYQFGALGVGGGDWHSPGDAQSGCPDPQYPQGYLNNYGELYVYDGNISVPTVEVTDGVINLWGGKLTCTSTEGHVFDIYRQVHSPSPNGPIYQVPSNKGINLAGGTLSIIGDHRADVNFLAFIADGRIIAYGYDTYTGPNCLFLSRGDVVADYNGTYTNYTGVAQLGRAWNPQPKDKVTQLEYDPPPMLSWGAGDDANNINGHVIYFSTDEAAVESETAYLATTTEPNYTFGSALDPGVTYYWKVNEVNTADEPDSLWVGQIWQFKTKGGTAVNPVPASGSTPVFDINALQISWSPGAFVADTDGHRIYFGTDYASVLAAGPGTAKIDRGTRTSPVYKLKDLASAYVLAANQTYYWRIDEVNGVDTWPGEVWNFTMSPYGVVEAFNYASQDGLEAVWKTGIKKAGCADDCFSVPGGVVTLGAANMQFAYDNDGDANCSWSEAKMDYNGFPVDWRASGVFPAKSLSLTYTGNITNSANPNYDRMFVAIEDSAGHFGVVLNPDIAAEARQIAATWQIKLSDLSGSPYNVVLNDINAMYIGFGERCTWSAGGGIGTVTFDDIRLYLSSCTPGSVTGDFNDDCFVNVYDLDIMAADWLDTDTTLTYATVTQPLAPRLWYKFDETSGTAVTDSSTYGNTGTVENLTSTTWESTGGYDGSGCINFDWGRRIDVNVPPAALGFFTGGKGVTFSLWIKADKNHPPTPDWPGPFGVRGDASGQYGDWFEIKLPTPAATPSASFIVWQNSSLSQTCAVDHAMSWYDFADRWNHYALTYDDTNNLMRIYLNGTQIGENTNVTVTMPLAPDNVYVGKRAADWAWWNGRVDDFRVYNYPLDANEVAYIATKGTGSITLPLVEVTNIVSSSPQRVNFRDFAMMAQQWLLEQP